MLFCATLWRLYLLFGFVIVGDVVAVSYPEAQLNGSDLGWATGEVPRIQHPELCRPMPPGERDAPNGDGILYVVGYLWSTGSGGLNDMDTRCRYYAYDANHDDEYEMKVEGFDINTCSPGPWTAGTFQACLMNTVNREFIMLYCVINGFTIDGYLMKLVKAGDQYKMVKQSYYRWENYAPIWNKHFYALISYKQSQNDYLMIGNAPPWLIHIKINNGVGSIHKWVGGGRTTYEPDPAGSRFFYRAQFAATQAALDYLNSYGLKYLFDCTYTYEDGDFCELTYDNSDRPVFNRVKGAFNQFDCLRVRRGQVHYDSSSQTNTAAGYEDPYGYIIEVFDLKTRAIKNQKCFYAPIFKEKDHHPGNVLPIWIGQSDIRTTLCEQGMDYIAPAQIPPEPRVGQTVCQTAILPEGARGKFRLIGMEPNNAPALGTRGLPRLAIYDGVQSSPKYIGDPAGMLKENCFVEENLSPTALAHFGIRIVDPDHFIVFCNRGYGSNEEFNEERRDNGSTIFAFRYIETPTEGVVDLLKRKHLRVAQGYSFNHFLDNRGVIMIPSTDGQTLHFVQMMPCAYFSVNVVDWEITVKSPNTQKDHVCENGDFSLAGAVVDLDQLADCVLKTCTLNDTEVIVGEAYESRNYITSDITRTQTSFVTGKYGCLQSKFQLVNESGSLHYVYTFDTDESPGNPMEPCFMPFEQSGGFQMIYLGNDTDGFCEDPWEFGGETPPPQEMTTPAPAVSKAFITAPPTLAPPDARGDANCENYFVDTLPAVGMAAALCLVCLSVFVTIVVASLIGRRNYDAHKAAEAPQYTDATAASAMTQVSQIPTQVVAPGATPTPQEVTPSAYNLFSKVGEFEKGGQMPTPPQPEAPVGANLFSKVGDFSKTQ